MRVQGNPLKIAASVFLMLTLAAYPTPTVAVAATLETSLEELVKRDYLELFELAPELGITRQQADEYKKQLESEKDAEERRLKDEKKRIEREIDAAQDELKSLNRDSASSPDIEERRHRIHCRIQSLRKDLRENELILDQGLGVRYDNLEAKVEILRDWPARYRAAVAAKESGEAANRKFGDFRDVGFRPGPFDDQEQDVEKGRETIDELKRRQMFPPELEDEEIQNYVRRLGERIARHSDLRVPLRISVLRSEEINAFALPGGFLYVNSGLLDKADSESELAGVVAHEIAHAAARHGNRLMGKANIASIVFQAAQIAALIFTGGAVSLGTYYLLQYGFTGLGLVLSLSLLGVSRDYEIEADILGTQYLWHANYDTRGFISFFGRMAQEEGYVSGLSWFRTHPPFADRMTRTFEEIVYLPEREEPIRDSSEFQRMKERLKPLLEEMKQRDENAPTLRRIYDCPDEMTE